MYNFNVYVKIVESKIKRSTPETRRHQVGYAQKCPRLKEVAPQKKSQPTTKSPSQEKPLG
jgi:hypothetical protein